MSDNLTHGSSERKDRSAATDYCAASPKSWYRVVDEQHRTIWDGGCRECAYMVASHDPTYRVERVPAGVIHHAA